MIKEQDHGILTDKTRVLWNHGAEKEGIGKNVSGKLRGKRERVQECTGEKGRRRR